jgi:hypothetical protein
MQSWHVSITLWSRESRSEFELERGRSCNQDTVAIIQHEYHLYFLIFPQAQAPALYISSHYHLISDSLATPSIETRSPTMDSTCGTLNERRCGGSQLATPPYSNPSDTPSRPSIALPVASAAQRPPFSTYELECPNLFNLSRNWLRSVPAASMHIDFPLVSLQLGRRYVPSNLLMPLFSIWHRLLQEM